MTLPTAYEEFTQIFALYGGQKYLIEESITQTSHALQAAAIAQWAEAPEEFTIGALLHDIGQIADANLVGNATVLHYNHAETGQAWLEKRGFPRRVCEIAGFHTLAKVVLCQADPTYSHHLSRASVNSLAIQRKKYSDPKFAERLHAFNSSPDKRFYLTARKVDDMAKVGGLDTEHGLPGFEAYREMTDRVLKFEGHEARNSKWMDEIDSAFCEMVMNTEAFCQHMKEWITR